MDPNLSAANGTSSTVRVFGAGDTGLGVLNLLIADGFDADRCVALNCGGAVLENSLAKHHVRVEPARLRGLGSGGDPERGRQGAEENEQELKTLCEGCEMVFIVTGLGGGSGTGISPVVARIAKAAGALVLAFVTTPFDCEGTRRQGLAEDGLENIRDHVAGVVCLPNQKIFKLIAQNTTVLETFRIANRLLADAVAGIWRLLTFHGLIEIHRDELCRFLQSGHYENAFAVAEAVGTDRAKQAVARLLAHPLLEDGELVPNADGLLVSVTGGLNLTMAEVNHVIEQIKAKSGGAIPMLVGACVEEQFGDKLAVTIIAASKLEQEMAPRRPAEGLDKQLLDRAAAAKPNSRFLPPAPELAPEQVQQLLLKQRIARNGGRKNSTKLRQTQLPLEIVSKGRFDKSEPTIHKGEDLDVPTYIRRGVALN